MKTMNALLLDHPGIELFPGFRIYYYAICIVTGMLLAAGLSALLMKRRNMSYELVFLGFIVAIPLAIVFARLFYCITDGTPFSEWLNIREGGLSILGGLMGGILGAFLVCFFKKVDFLRAADCVMPTILIAQTLGRWGNFMNCEVYGGEVASEAMRWFPFAVPVSSRFPGDGIAAFSDPNVTWHYAFFFYEGLLNLIGFALLFTAAWKRTSKPNGLIACAYLVWYGTVRTVMEPLRDPQYILQGAGVPWSLVVSVLMIVGGLAGAAVLLFFNYRKEGSLLGSKKGDPCAIRAYMTPYKDDKPYFSKINIFGAEYPEKPEKETFRYKWRVFLSRIRGETAEEEAAPSDPDPSEKGDGEEHSEHPERETRSEEDES